MDCLLLFNHLLDLIITISLWKGVRKKIKLKKQVLHKKKDKNDHSPTHAVFIVCLVMSHVLSLYLCFVSCQERLLERQGLVHEDISLFHMVFNLGLCGI